MPAADTLLFVYGTLKRGGANHAMMRDQRYLGPARTAPGHTLYSLGEYPGMVADQADANGVDGELWMVSPEAQARLDTFEGVHEGLYARKPVALATWPDQLATKTAPQAKTYLYLREIVGRPHIGSLWPI